ncbi:hypothetical protein HMPREF9374_0867 [Desmospora sp. 8437]|nr:hypothetical protein HMPREF9374_0867 [Desmospora sp. 8437]
MKNLNRPSHVKKTGNAQRVTGFFLFVSHPPLLCIVAIFFTEAMNGG